MPASEISYDALTLDANIVIQEGFNFESGRLAQLQQFNGGPADFILSQVVFQEIYKHLLKATHAAAEVWEAASAKAIRFGLMRESHEGKSSHAPALTDPSKAAMARISGFHSNCGVRLISPELAATKDVMDLYFHGRPPFAATGKKKEEFPDAIALLSLESWAKSAGKKVLAVSKDTGWREFADGSEFIDVVSELAEALSIFQRHAEHAVQKVRVFLARAESGEDSDAWDEMQSRVAEDVGGIFFDLEYESKFSVETDDLDVEFEGLELSRKAGEHDITVVRMGRTEIVAQVAVGIALEATGWFSLYVDARDDHSEPVGHASSTINATMDTDLLLTFAHDAGEDAVGLSLQHVELVEEFGVIDFGAIDLDSVTSRNQPVEDLPQLPFDDPPRHDPSIGDRVNRSDNA